MPVVKTQLQADDLPAPPHRDPAGDRFRNPDGRAPRGFFDVLRWKLKLGPPELSEISPAGEPPPPYVPDLATPDAARLRRPDPARVQMTWVGHSTCLLQLGGFSVLTDPQWSRRASPVPFAGPARLAPPTLALDDLPPLDVVLLSHNHYDHLDAPTLRQLAGRTHRFEVPLGLKSWFDRKGIENVAERDWGQRAQPVPGLQLRCVPAQHWSSRSPWDRRRTLWCGWVVEAGGKRVFFAGDTGWASGMFEQIGREYGPFDLALLPIGAYAPRWFMADQHADGRDAVRIHRAVRARRSLGIHWGTFQLTDEPPAEPPLLLAKALAEAGVLPEEFRPARLGETVTI